MKEVEPPSVELWIAPRAGKLAVPKTADYFRIVSFFTEEREMLV